MSRCRGFLALSCAVVLCAPGATPFSPAADKGTAPMKGKVAGILIEKKDAYLIVKADGEDEPVKYVFGESPDRKLAGELKAVFNAARVQLTYEQDGDSRRLLGTKRQVLRASGTVTGTVVKVYDEFWVEVKPKEGPSDAYAPGANFNNKEFMAKLRGLKPGDSVTIRFNTDFERHRILSLRVNDDKSK
jgi:hypothetical protein